MRKLGMSDGEANRRIAAARVLRRFPVARGYLERGAISARKAKAGKRRPRRTGRAHIPRAVVREVFARDGEQCTYVDAEGNRCPARGFLELDHIRAKARGGGDDAMNLRARCRLHNRWHAEQVFGREYIEERIHLRRRTYAPPASPAEAQPPSPAGAQPPSPAVAPPTSPAVAQPPSPAVAQPTSPAVAQPTSPAVAQSSTAETPPVVVPSSFDTVARALRSLGFREPEVRAAMTRLRTMLDPALPNETILREALRLLT